MDYTFLLQLAIILVSTKLLGLVTKKFQMPQVVGALLAGLILGPAVLGVVVVGDSEFIKDLAEIGVVVLMFSAGLETSISDLKKSGKASFIIALIGVLVPLGGGFLVSMLFNKNGLSGLDSNVMLQNIFIGVILTATSVSITVETLKEIGKLNTKSGNAILGAAIIDDVLGIVGLTIIISMSGGNSSGFAEVGIVILKIAAFFIVAGVAGYFFYRVFEWWADRYSKDMRRFVILAFVFCLVLSFCAEHFFGVADITGAFLAGLVLSNSKKSKYIASRFETTSYMLLSPVFFASIGLEVVLPKTMSGGIIWFTVILTIVAVLTKVIGCGLGAKICKYSNKESLQIGVGMISRGEVALIVAQKGIDSGLMGSNFLGPVIIVVVITTIVTPILLKLVYGNKHKNDDEHQNDSLADRLNEIRRYNTEDLGVDVK